MSQEEKMFHKNKKPIWIQEMNEKIQDNNHHLSLSSTMTLEKGQCIFGQTLVKMLGEGGQGQAWLCKSDENKDIAIKFYMLDIKKCNIEKKLRELQLALKLRHHNICNVFDVRYDKQNNIIGIIQEYCELGNLKDWLEIYRKKLPGYNISIQDSTIYFFKELLSVFYYLNSQYQTDSNNIVIHRDIKLENIFLKKQKSLLPQIKLGDFGLARELALGQDASTNVGTYDTMAPELLEAKINNLKLKYNKEADVYSLGCAMYCMLFGEYPFTNKNGKNNTTYEILQRIKAKELRQRPEDISVELYNIISQMLEYKPTKRITFQKLFESYQICEYNDQQAKQRTKAWEAKNIIKKKQIQIVIKTDQKLENLSSELLEIFKQQKHQILEFKTDDQDKFSNNQNLDDQQNNYCIIQLFSKETTSFLNQIGQEQDELRKQQQNIVLINIFVAEQQIQDSERQNIKSDFINANINLNIIINNQFQNEDIQQIIFEMQTQVFFQQIKLINKTEKQLSNHKNNAQDIKITNQNTSNTSGINKMDPEEHQTPQSQSNSLILSAQENE